VYNVLADLIIVLHFLFIAFIVSGGLLVIRWPKTAFIHLPAAIWGFFVEFSGRICPLTPLENYFRNLSGESSYSGDFISRYLIPVIYPENLTITIQHFLGALLIIINIFFYIIVLRRLKRSG
jgi:hypothetical protein